jgi:hypothetical protein
LHGVDANAGSGAKAARERMAVRIWHNNARGSFRGA